MGTLSPRGRSTPFCLLARAWIVAPCFAVALVGAPSFAADTSVAPDSMPIVVNQVRQT